MARRKTPPPILQAGWDKLVEVLDRGHYVPLRLLGRNEALGRCSVLSCKQDHQGGGVPITRKEYGDALALAAKYGLTRLDRRAY
jgi:hypothetical protein